MGNIRGETNGGEGGGRGAFCHFDSPAGREISIWQLKMCVETELILTGLMLGSQS